MILGHITNTYALHSLGGNVSRRFLSIVPLLVGVITPDVLDKLIYYTLTSYPSRGVFHSVLALTLLFIVPWFATGRRFMFFPIMFFGSMLHLAQDMIDPVVALWPLLGEVQVYPTLPIWEKVKTFYIDERFTGLWVVEIVSLTYCVLHLAVRSIKKFRENT